VTDAGLEDECRAFLEREGVEILIAAQKDSSR
jgi:hypothetical protein